MHIGDLVLILNAAWFMSKEPIQTDLDIDKLFRFTSEPADSGHPSISITIDHTLGHTRAMPPSRLGKGLRVMVSDKVWSA